MAGGRPAGGAGAAGRRVVARSGAADAAGRCPTASTGCGRAPMPMTTCTRATSATTARRRGSGRYHEPAVAGDRCAPVRSERGGGRSLCVLGRRGRRGILCRLDDGAFAACTSPFEVAELGEGTHRFEVKARDTAGNESAASAFAWTIDRTAPEPPVIDEHPTATTISDRARFAFSAAEPACGSCARWTTRTGSVLEPAGVRVARARATTVPRDRARRGGQRERAGYRRVDGRSRRGEPGRRRMVVVRRPARACTVQGRTYVGWVARDGDVKVSAYDHATRSRTTALVAPAVELDDHANPALQVLPDGRLRVFYSAHGGTTMSYRSRCARTTSRPGSPRGRCPRTRRDRGGSRIRTRCISPPRRRRTCSGAAGTSTRRSDPARRADAWSPARTLISAPGRPYVKVDSDGEATIHFAFTNAHPERGRGRQHPLRRLPRRRALARRRHPHRPARAPRSPRSRPTASTTPAARPGCTTSRSTATAAR